MVVFEDIQDVRDWLDPLDYIAFWEAVEPYRLVLQDRDHCDDLIASGAVEGGGMRHRPDRPKLSMRCALSVALPRSAT